MRVNVRALNDKIRPVTAAELAWQSRQPVIGSPSLSRLRAALKQAGYAHIRLRLDSDREILKFSVRRGILLRQPKGDRLLKLLIRKFRHAGFAIGWSELAVHSIEKSIIGTTLTAPVDQVAEHGAPEIEDL